MSTPTADDVRRAVLRDGIKGRDEEIARYQGRAERAEADAATLREKLVKVGQKWQRRAEPNFADPDAADATLEYWNGVQAVCREIAAALTSEGQG